MYRISYTFGVFFCLAVLAVGWGCRHQPPGANPAVGYSGNHRGEADWIPSEFKRGRARWRDAGVYVDGKPLGILRFGELPIALKPVWHEEEASIPFKPGHQGSKFKMVKQRRYRVSDYLQSAGVDLNKIREVHVYGSRYSDVIVVPGPEFLKRKKDIYFRFGGDVRGNILPVVPDGLGNNKSPDRLVSLLVYIDRKPPTWIRNEGMEIDGQIVKDVPYFGAPLRGGVRVYSDDRLVSVIKRRLLEDAGGLADTRAGLVRWRLLPFLASQGVNIDPVVEAWTIHHDRRRVRLPRKVLETLTFEVNPQGKGEIFLGPDRVPAHALALHSRVVSMEELPQIFPSEEN